MINWLIDELEHWIMHWPVKLYRYGHFRREGQGVVQAWWNA